VLSPFVGVVFEESDLVVTVEIIKAALKGLIDPHTKTDFVSASAVKNIRVEGGDISLDIVLGYPA
jgi:ATP-binding protein involved in chromosome partitioning